jgi:hypothetical protein
MSNEGEEHTASAPCLKMVISMFLNAKGVMQLIETFATSDNENDQPAPSNRWNQSHGDAAWRSNKKPPPTSKHLEDSII